MKRLIGKSGRLALAMCSALGIGSAFVSQPSAFAQSAPHITLTVSTWDSGNGLVAYKRGIAYFEKENPNIKVQIESIPWNYYMPKILTQMANGSAPDLMLVGDDNMPAFMKSGMISSLNFMFTPKYHLSVNDFIPNSFYIGNKPGAIYFVPKDAEDANVIYNKAMFKAAHLAFPKPGWTWQQFINDAKRLTIKRSGRTVQWGALLPGTGLRSGIEELANEWGGRILSANGKTASGYLNSRATQNAIKFYVNMYTQDHISPTPSQTASFGNIDLFMTGKVALEPTGSWNLEEYRQDPHLQYGVVPMPLGPTHKPTTVTWTAGWALYSRTQNRDAAVKLLRFFASRKWASINDYWGIPVRKDPQVDAQMIKQDPAISVFLQQRKYIAPLETTQTMNWSKDVQPALQQMLEQAILKPNSNVSSLIQQAAKQIDSNLQQDYTQ